MSPARAFVIIYVFCCGSVVPPALIKYIKPVFVSRSDQDSRKKTVEEIKRRAHSGGEWPQVKECVSKAAELSLFTITVDVLNWTSIWRLQFQTAKKLIRGISKFEHNLFTDAVWLQLKKKKVSFWINYKAEIEWINGIIVSSVKAGAIINSISWVLIVSMFEWYGKQNQKNNYLTLHSTLLWRKNPRHFLCGLAW